MSEFVPCDICSHEYEEDFCKTCDYDVIIEKYQQLQAENERLKKCQAITDKSWRELQADLAAANAEVERLNGSWEPYREEFIKKLAAENERLKNEIAQYKIAMNEEKRILPLKLHEIERLKERIAKRT